MDIFMNKTALSIIAAVLLALAGSACSKKTYRVERVINAPPKEVWDVLMDTASYADWNPVFVKVKGNYVEGGEVINTFKDPSGKLYEVTNKVKAVVPEKQLRQQGGMPLVITFDHQWLLEPVPQGTRVAQYEVDRGFYVWFWDDSWVIPSYTEVLFALDGQVKSRRQNR